MSQKVLFVTVGGSCKPIVKSIIQNKPDFIYFICSDDKDNNKGSYNMVIGEGKVCGGNPAEKGPPDQENILTQANYCRDYKIKKIATPDDFNDCYQKAISLIEESEKSFPNYKKVIDYTGGTKSMSAGLVAAASSFKDILISLVAGARNDLIKTIDGTESVKLTRVNNAFLHEYFEKAELLLRHYDYFGVWNMIEELYSEYSDIPQDLRRKADELKLACKAFDYWDKFEHAEAYKTFSMSKTNDTFINYKNSLRPILKSKMILDEKIKLEELNIHYNLPVSNFEILYDLIQNAKRKASVGAFDDAVARIYRCIELFIQIHLKAKYGISTSDIDLSKVPDGAFKDKLKNARGAKVQTALIDSYSLLGTLDPTDVIYLKFTEVKKNILSVLETRNYSILAHGSQPIGSVKYREIEEIAINRFISPLIEPELNRTKLFSKEQLPNKM